ncbi:uncharacterized protein LOC122536093 [Frieseomelitta varia]|nr:uncharacterized protein LOC122536093 [Frieseomelitta varia]
MKKLPIYLLALQHVNYLRYLSTNVVQPVNDLLRRNKFTDVQFVVQNPYGRSDHGAVDEIYKTVSRVLPTSCISFNGSIPPELSFFHASRTTLILYVYIARTLPDFEQTGNITAEIMGNNRPKVLLMTMLEEQNCNFEQFLEQTWHRYLIDMTVLELSEPNGSAVTTMIHRYNPFTRVYDQRPYASGVEWFPNKVQNLHGYPMRVGMLNRTDYIWFIRNLLKYESPDVKTMKTLARVMNFTIVKVPDKRPVQATADGKCDIIIPSLSIYADNFSRLIEYTLPLDFENWCPVIPLKYKYNKSEGQALVGLAINCCIVLVFWGISVVLKFNSDLWQPLKIFGMLIAVAMPSKPRGTKERVIFFAILIASSIYSTNLFVDLTTVSMTEKTEMDYKTYEELDKSGLIPVVVPDLLNVTFVNDDESFLRLKRKTITGDTLEQSCINYLKQHQNVTCFQDTTGTNMIIYMEARLGNVTAKICKNLCYVRLPVAYFLRKHSPYKDRFVDIITRLRQTGIRRKWSNDYIGKIRPKKASMMEINSLYKSSLVWNLIWITSCGLLVSFLAFLGEVITHRVHRVESVRSSRN